MKRSLALLAAAVLTGAAAVAAATPAQAATSYDINTLAGKVASLHGTAGLQVRFSAFIEEEAEDDSAPPAAAPISPPFVLSSPLDGTSVQPPAVTVNQDTAGAPQNETAIAVDPNNPQRIVAGANDYVTRTWTCTIAGTPCSALGDGYSGGVFYGGLQPFSGNDLWFREGIVVPEPSSVLLLFIGGGIATWLVRKRSGKSKGRSG